MNQQSEKPGYLRVSPRHLGQMRLATFCPSCFWYAIALGFRYPFDMPMPGIMHNLDKFEKLLVEAYFNKHGKAPKWLSQLGCTGPVDFPEKMTEDISNLGITLVGMPDGVFKKKDGSLCVVDYKTAKHKGEDDPFLPAYQTQLQGYARLLEHYEIGQVTSAALVYFQNDLSSYAAKPLDLLTDTGITVPFTVEIHNIELDPKAIDELLKKFRKFADLPAPPEGSEKCKTCQRLDRLFQVEHRLLSTQKIIKDFENCDTARMHWILNRKEASRRSSLVLESRGWEAELDELLVQDLDSVPGSLDL